MAKKNSRKGTDRPSLLDLAKKLPPKRAPNFLDKLTPDVQAELLELRAAYHAGDLPAHITGPFLFTEVVEKHHPGCCSESTWRKWLNDRSANG